MASERNNQTQREAAHNSSHDRAKVLFGVRKIRQQIIENMGMLVAAGVGVPYALRAIQEESRVKVVKDIVGGMMYDLETGNPVWRAFERAGIFPQNIVSLVRIGEESGKLSENLKVVADQTKKNAEFRSQVRSAMLYPVFVLVLTLGLGIGIAWFILPRLALVFTQLNLQLPTVTKAMIDLGLFLGDYGIYVVPVFIVLVVLFFYFLFFHPKTKFIGQELLFAVPGIRKLVRDIELARFGFLFGSLLEAGMPITEAMASIKDSTLFPRYQKFYAYLESAIDEGNSFQKSMALYPGTNRIIPVSIQQIIVSAEKSGSLISSFHEIARAAELRSQTATKNISVILEPILLVIVWVGVIAVAFAVILPIYDLVGGINL